MPQPGSSLPPHLGSARLFKASGTKVRPPPLGDGPVRPRKVPGTAGVGRAARGRRPEAGAGGGRGGEGAVVLRGLRGERLGPAATAMRTPLGPHPPGTRGLSCAAPAR